MFSPSFFKFAVCMFCGSCRGDRGQNNDNIEFPTSAIILHPRSTSFRTIQNYLRFSFLIRHNSSLFWAQRTL